MALAGAERGGDGASKPLSAQDTSPLAGGCVAGRWGARGPPSSGERVDSVELMPCKRWRVNLCQDWLEMMPTETAMDSSRGEGVA